MEIIDYKDKINEINMNDIIYHGIEGTDFLVIQWTLLYECNYKCSYCFGQAPLSNNFTPIEKLKHAVDQIFKIDKKQYTFLLAGGEIVYYPHLIELLEYIDSFKKNVSIYFYTNGSKSIEYFKKVISTFKNMSLYFSLSVHLEYADLEHIKNLTELFFESKHSILVHIMAHPELEDKIKYFYHELVNFVKDQLLNISISVVPLFEPPTFTKIDSRYNDAFFDWMMKNRYDLKYKSPDNILYPKSYFNINNNNDNLFIDHNLAIKNNLKNFTNFYCCGGINSIFINHNGEYKSTICNVSKVIGNIYEDDIDIYSLTNYTICNIYQCSCATNDVTSKYRNIKDANLYISKYRKKYSNLIFEYKINNLFNEINYLNNEINTIKNSNKKLVDAIAWWIPIKKLRENFKNKFRPDQTRPDQTRNNM